MSTQRPGYSGPRPQRTVEGYVNAAMDRQEALDIVADAGLLASPMRIEIRASGKGYDAVLPVEGLQRLAEAVADDTERKVKARILGYE